MDEAQLQLLDETGVLPREPELDLAYTEAKAAPDAATTEHE